MPYQSKNPYNNEVLATFDTLTDAQLEEKLAKLTKLSNLGKTQRLKNVQQSFTALLN